MNIRSPFYVIEEFISPLACEEMIDILNYTVPDVDKDGYPIFSTRSNERAGAIIYERLLYVLPELQAYYEFLYKGTHPIQFEWFPTGSANTPHAENSEFLRGKWMRSQAKDFTGVLFMADYQDKVPFEKEYEVLGGKLEFPQHAFGFNPIRGTMIVFPSDPHFINASTQTLIGDLFQARIHIAAQTPYLYQPEKFPGNYLSWFQSLLTK
ncbi:hypothetical protein E4H12_00800 [Candidatus Thorarchaeota archaeon]|nr:MAG: hypothetical protein E4H12_00800 [Candidatus Thorarchaeota archaeon]